MHIVYLILRVALSLLFLRIAQGNLFEGGMSYLNQRPDSDSTYITFYAIYKLFSSFACLYVAFSLLQHELKKALDYLRKL